MAASSCSHSSRMTAASAWFLTSEPTCRNVLASSVFSEGGRLTEPAAASPEELPRLMLCREDEEERLWLLAFAAGEEVTELDDLRPEEEPPPNMDEKAAVMLERCARAS